MNSVHDRNLCKKTFLTFVLIALAAIEASAATQSEFEHYIWLAKTGQLQANSQDDRMRLHMNIYTVAGDYSVTRSPVYLMEIVLLQSFGKKLLWG